MKSLNEAETFDKDINMIMNVVEGIERDYKFKQMLKRRKCDEANNSMIAMVGQPTNVFYRRKHS